MRRTAFTLLELMLAISLMVVLAVMVMPMFGGAVAKRQLLESADQLRSLFYLSSAQARESGRRIEVRFVTPAEKPLASTGQSATGAQVFIERDPLGAPGVFDPLAVDWANWSVAGAKVQIVDVQVTEAITLAQADSAALDLDAGPKDSGWPTVMLTPAGRSGVGDVTITLRNDKLEGYVVTVSGATGLATIAPVAALDPETQEAVATP